MYIDCLINTVGAFIKWPAVQKWLTCEQEGCDIPFHFFPSAPYPWQCALRKNVSGFPSQIIQIIQVGHLLVLFNWDSWPGDYKACLCEVPERPVWGGQVLGVGFASVVCSNTWHSCRICPMLCKVRRKMGELSSWPGFSPCLIWIICNLMFILLLRVPVQLYCVWVQLGETASSSKRLLMTLLDGREGSWGSCLHQGWAYMRHVVSVCWVG